MESVRKMLVLVLLALWPVVTNHCRLELLPGLDFLACDTPEPASSHQSSDCETDGCATVESSLYKSEDGEVLVGKPSPIHADLPVALLSFSSGEGPVEPVVETKRAGFRSKWQFALRAAALPRAPSLVS
jgi:hypothetical protein